MPGIGGEESSGQLSESERRWRKAERKYKKEILDLQRTIKDLDEEFVVEKANQLETLREMSKEGKLFEKICRALLSDKELTKVSSFHCGLNNLPPNDPSFLSPPSLCANVGLGSITL